VNKEMDEALDVLELITFILIDIPEMVYKAFKKLKKKIFG
jgi:hypothetical protein